MLMQPTLIKPTVSQLPTQPALSPMSDTRVSLSMMMPGLSMMPVVRVPETVIVTTVTNGDLCTSRHGVHTGGFEAQAAEYHAFGKGLIHASWAAKPKADHFQRWKSVM